VIAARQTLLTTYLLYQGLAYLGDQATAVLSALERDPSSKADVGQPAAAGWNRVLVQTPERWKKWAKFSRPDPSPPTRTSSAAAAAARSVRVRLR